MIFFYILVFAAPMPNHPLFEAHVAGFTVVKWVGIACCVFALIELSKGRKAPGFLSSVEACAFLALFCIAAVSSVTLSNTSDITFRPMASYVSFALLFFVTIALVNSYERLHATLLSAIAGEAFTSLYVIREFQASGGTDLRPGYIAGDSNYFATCAVLVIPIAMYFAWKSTSRRERWFCGISLFLILFASTLASSRGGLIGLCVVMGYLVLRSGKSRKAAILVALVLLPLLLYLPASPLSRMLHPDYADKLGSEIRWDFWRAGFKMIQNHPLTGIGLGNFSAYSNMFIFGVGRRHGIACNTFLELTAELGFPGVLAYCMILWGALRSAGRLRAEGKKRKDLSLLYTGEAMQAGLLGFIAGAMFLSAEYQKPLWVIVALAAAVPTLVKRKRREGTVHMEEATKQGNREYIATTA
jgi:O-antigen ligase